MSNNYSSQKLAINIRPFEASDYEVVAGIRNQIFHEYPLTTEEFSLIDKRRGPKYRFQRFVAESNGSIAGYSDYDQIHFMYHPQKFDINIFVQPAQQNQGIGTALYLHLFHTLKQFDPLTLRCGVREDAPQTLRFVQKRDFQEAMRQWESHLDLCAFDFSRYDGHIERVEAGGIKLLPVSQIPRNPENDRKLYDLTMMLEGDVPQPDPFTPIEYESFVERTFGHPDSSQRLFISPWMAAIMSA